MVFEQIVSVEKLQKKPLVSFLLGLSYTFIGAGTAFLFFRSSLSVATLFFITILLLPSLMKLIQIGEERSKRMNLGVLIRIYVFIHLF